MMLRNDEREKQACSAINNQTLSYGFTVVGVSPRVLQNGTDSTGECNTKRGYNGFPFTRKMLKNCKNEAQNSSENHS